MATLLELQAQLAAINATITSGVSRASTEGKSADMRSLAELRSIRDDLLRQLGLPSRTRRTVAGFRSGL